MCSGISGAIFSQSSSLIRHLLSVIFSPSEIINYDILTIPYGIGSKDFNYGHGASFLFRLRRQHFTVAQRICTTAQCFHIYFGNAGK
ncbi:hypothetical protein SI60_23300 [Salmonella enterica]|nr:hypothetical protein [Salmonella enterica]EBP3183426.1 hypothetical protein [Salmonella enterica]EDO2095597.1 hypothetical protein [Salmonella enterica]EDS8697035.1 hypothetical protein [Salmonella enterica]